MEGWKELIDSSLSTPRVLELYLRLRLLLKELGHTEKSIQRIKSGPQRLWNFRTELHNQIQKLYQLTTDYGFDVTYPEFVDYLEQKFNKINELTPLNDGDYQGDDTGDEDNQ